MKKQLLGFMFASVTVISTAQTLDLETCLKMADTANLTIRNARLDVSANKDQIAAYMSARLPTVTATGDYKYNAIIPGQLVPAAMFGGQPGEYTTVQFGVPYNLSNTLQLTQVLFNPQVNYGINALKINQKIIEVQQRITERDVKHQVASTFFNLQAINKQLAFVGSDLISMEKLINNMDAMQQQGMIIPTEVDKLRINKLSLLNSQQTLTATKTQLESLMKILLGFPDSATLQFTSDDLMEKTVLIDETTIDRPELDLLKAQYELNLEERKGTNMAYLPSLSLYGAYNFTYNLKPDDNVRKGIESAFIGLRLDWTLFDGLEKYNKQKVNAINRTKLENQQEYLNQQLELQTANAKRQIEIQNSSLSIAKEQLTLAQRVYDLTESQYTQGTVGSNDLITAENGLQLAQTKVVIAYLQLRQAELDYLKSIGLIK